MPVTLCWLAVFAVLRVFPDVSCTWPRAPHGIPLAPWWSGAELASSLIKAPGRGGRGGTAAVIEAAFRSCPQRGFVHHVSVEEVISCVRENPVSLSASTCWRDMDHAVISYNPVGHGEAAAVMGRRVKVLWENCVDYTLTYVQLGKFYSFFLKSYYH